MMAAIDHTHDPVLRSWVDSANGHSDFPIQNLPLGVFSSAGTGLRAGIAIGDEILDLSEAREAMDDGSPELGAALSACNPPLNDLLALGRGPRRVLRHAASALLCESAPPRPAYLRRAADCIMHLPVRIGDYTDFYAGIHHATNVGRQFRPENPLLPNYKWIPIGYHGRASSVQPSGVPVRRPSGQLKRPGAEQPAFAPTEKLDFELELGIWIGPGNAQGTPIPIAGAADHIAGYCLLNDWSARDIQAWEYQPLGPFLAKSFHTTISPWIVTPEALAPFRAPAQSRPRGDPLPLPYLLDETDQQIGGLHLELEVRLQTSGARAKGLAPHLLSIASATNLYWTPAQMVAHHASNGCNLQPGDLLGTGTISAADSGGYGSLLEITEGSRVSLSLVCGEMRLFIEDGDEIIISGHARAEGFVPIGFGTCRAAISDG